MRVFDEEGVAWEVAATGDAASSLVRHAEKAHCSFAVLPRKTLISGVLRPPARMPDDLTNRVRLLDLLGVLQHGEE